MKQLPVTVEQLREMLHYEPETGELTWLVSPAAVVRAGDRAGFTSGKGYRYVTLRGKPYPAHRVIWAHAHGELPQGNVDHINGDRQDNRLANLRDVPPKVNSQNRRAATKPDALLGVHGPRLRYRNPWSAKICVDGRSVHLGSFPTAEAAHEAYVAAKRRLHAGCTI